MDQFDSAYLSPLARTARALPLPYGLTWEELMHVLPGFDLAQAERAYAIEGPAKQGLNGGANSCILRLRYPAGGSRLHSRLVFIKQNAEPSVMEVQRYAFIAARDVPTPRVLAVIPKNGTEVILLEFLPRIGVDFQQNSEVDEMLRLAAALNALSEGPAGFVPGAGSPQEAFDALLRDALARLAREPGNEMVDPARWLDAYHAALEASRAMPLALCHNQFYFQQIGWAGRGKGRRLVLFDLETMFLSRRFTDIGTFLYPLSQFSSRPQFELFQVYLDALRALTGDLFDARKAFREMRTLRLVLGAESLPWLAECLDQSQSQLFRGELDRTLACFHEDLTALR
jgi:hypothetical protein